MNYHFGDKATLYVEVLRYAHGKVLGAYPLLLGVAGIGSGREKLHAFVFSLLSRILRRRPDLVAWPVDVPEMIEPSCPRWMR